MFVDYEREVLNRVENIVGNINRVNDLKKLEVIALNYEELKNEMKIEDFIYEIFMQRIAKETNREIEFKGENILFRRK